MKVAYLLNRVQKDVMPDIIKGQRNDNHLYGMLRLSQYGVQGDYLEIEQYMPGWMADFLRRFLNVYWIHALLFFNILSYDVVFTSTAFGTQLLYALYPFKKPKWVMLDFNITGFLGEEKTLKQRLFLFLVKRSHGIVTIDEHEKVLLQSRFPEMADRIVFLPFSVDTDVFKPQFKPQNEVPVKPFIFSPGRDPGRDFKILFKSIDMLINTGAMIDPSIVITARPWNIKGVMPLPKYLIHTDLSEKDLIKTYDRSSMVVIPLDTSSLVNNAMGCSTVVEAMSMGKAVIATRTPTTESYIKDGINGILVPKGDAGAMAQAIKSLLDDGQKAKVLGSMAREFAQKECAAPKFAKSLAEFFLSLK